jgi:2-polyprenyl-6-methoxyphenol hydroxylase-like FAD-dependent oxidoreductase
MSPTVPVLIAGGGPAGLMLAIELGRRSVSCLLVEEDVDPPSFPKANLTNARTMEHYRRLGFAAEIRALGLPADCPQDVTYFTRYATHELARFHVPSAAQAARLPAEARGNWHTPEMPHRIQQTLIEPVLRAKLQALPSVRSRFGWRLVAFDRHDDHVDCIVEHAATGRRETVAASYLAGCEGARSGVRQALGIRYAGDGGAIRDFMGGRMMTVHIRAPALYQRINGAPAWQYWSVNRERRALLIAIDGRGEFALLVQLPDEMNASLDFARDSLRRAVGADVAVERMEIGEWTAGYALVAQRFGDGRVVLLGDAAHLFTPTGGLGYNTAVDDAANLGWKLAATVQGWGGPALLSSYEIERKPVAERNTGYARAMADSVGRIAIPECLEAASPEGEAARRELGTRLHAHAASEFGTTGLQLGIVYDGSPIVVPADEPVPENTPTHYTPSACPGARAPHIELADGTPIFDRFGFGFTLLRLGGVDIDVAALRNLARERRVPFTVVDIPDAAARDLYGRDLVLVRPDQHVAWRGNAVPADVGGFFARVTGFAADA